MLFRSVIKYEIDSEEVQNKFNDDIDWIESAKINDNIQVLTKGSKEMKILARLETNDLDEAANYLFDTNQLSKWTPWKWEKVSDKEYWENVVKVTNLDIENTMECIKSRKLEFCKDGKSAFIIESSVKSPEFKDQEICTDSCIKL